MGKGGAFDRFRVIEGGDKPKPYRARKKGAPEPLVCQCGSATTIEVKTGRMLVDGKVQGGTKQIACFRCGKILA